MVSDEEIDRQWRTLRLIVYSLLLLAPVVYLMVVYLQLRNPSFKAHPRNLMLFLFLAYAIFQASLIPIIEKKMIARYAAKRLVGKALLEAGQTIVICKLSLVNAIYIYGLILFFMTGSVSKLPYFYAIGIVLTILFWPSESRFTELVRRLETT